MTRIKATLLGTKSKDIEITTTNYLIKKLMTKKYYFKPRFFYHLVHPVLTEVYMFTIKLKIFLINTTIDKA